MTELNFSGQLRGDRRDDERQQHLVDAELAGEVLDGIDEEDGPDDDQAEGGEDLEVDDPEPRDRRIRPMRAAVDAMEAERSEVLGIDVRVGLEVSLDVPGVDADEGHGDDPLEPDRFEGQERRTDRERVGDREVAHVVGEDLRVDLHRVAGRASPAGQEDRDAGHEHREGGQHERGAQDRADPDRVRRLATREQDRDDRDHRLGQGGPDGREHGADRALGELELASEPLDAVGEQLGTEQDDEERGDEDDQVQFRSPC